jgi:hypothetical protein
VIGYINRASGTSGQHNGAMMAILSGMSPNHKHTYASAEQWMYAANGYDVPHAWNGLLATAPQSGKAAPTSTPALSATSSGSVDTGVHVVQYRYIDTSTGWPSNASAEAQVSTAPNKSINVQVLASADSRVDKIVLEMTTAGGAAFFKVSEVDNTAGWYNMDISDNALLASTLAYDDLGHDRPPVGRLQAYHRGRFFIGGREEHAVGLAYSASTGPTITFTGADIRAALADGFFHRTDDAVAYSIATVDSTGDTGQITLDEDYPGSFSSATYRVYPANRNRVDVSKALYPESFPTDSWVRVLKGTGDTLKAMMPYSTAIAFFGERNMELLEWELDPTDTTDARLVPIPGGRGALTQEVVVEQDGVIYSIDRKGVFRWNGGAPQAISQPVQEVIDAINFENPERFHAHFDPINRQYVVFVVYGNETYPQTALVYNVDDGTWATHFYDRAISASTALPDGQGFERPFTGTVDGATWFGGIGYSDGVFPGTTMKGTVVSGASTSSVNCSEGGFYVSGQKLAGVSTFWKEGGEYSSITSNTTSGLTLSPAFTSAPSSGDTIFLGRIWAVHKSKQFRVGGPLEDQKGFKLALDFTPLTSAASLIVKIYKDGSAVASTWSANSLTDGVTFQASDEILVDLTNADGHVEIPLEWNWQKSVTFEFIIDQANIPFELIRYHLIADVEDGGTIGT